MLYETNPNKCKMKSMGIVLKRRDNAACVKDCYGQVVDMLMKGDTSQKAANFVKFVKIKLQPRLRRLQRQTVVDNPFLAHDIWTQVAGFR